jgi:hypothetical protein
VPTLKGALAAWSEARGAPEPQLELLHAAARDLAGALAGTHPGSCTTPELVAAVPAPVEQPVSTLLTELDRARFAGGIPDLALLDLCVETAAQT